jgi:hypothetical protein
MCNGHDLYFIYLHGEMDDVLEPAEKCAAKFDLGSRKLAYAKPAGILLNFHQFAVNFPPEFFSKTGTL